MPRMTDTEVIDALRSSAPLNKARAQFSNWAAKIENSRDRLSPIEKRRLEFEATRAIIDAFSDI